MNLFYFHFILKCYRWMNLFYFHFTLKCCWMNLFYFHFTLKCYWWMNMFYFHFTLKCYWWMNPFYFHLTLKCYWWMNLFYFHFTLNCYWWMNLFYFHFTLTYNHPIDRSFRKEMTPNSIISLEHLFICDTVIIKICLWTTNCKTIFSTLIVSSIQIGTQLQLQNKCYI